MQPRIDRTAPDNAEARECPKEIWPARRAELFEEMAAWLAHELNQPLTGILNNASAGRRFIAKGRADIPKLDALFQAVVEDTKRAREIIRSIRAMLSEKETARTPVDLNCVITDLERVLRTDGLKRHCAIVTELDLNLPRVMGNPVLLQQALLNIILNAFDAMQEIAEQKWRVVIRSELKGEAARVTVRDFGTGLPAVNPERIFDHSFSTKVHGMGMGLTIARSIILSHGGALCASNAKDGGTSVFFSLPTINEAA